MAKNMINQKRIFLESEGNNWFSRNNLNINNDLNIKNDMILKIISRNKISKESVLEIGCANGYRLNEIKKKFKSEVFGIDPSLEAIKHGKKKFPEVKLKIGTAEKLKFEDDKFDLIIFGFCLYLCDREDLIKIVDETNRVLKNKGHIIIYDFYSKSPYYNNYIHKEGIKSYKMDYSKIFLWNPFYKLKEKKIFEFNRKFKDKKDNKLAVFLINKSIVNAYPKYR